MTAFKQLDVWGLAYGSSNPDSCRAQQPAPPGSERMAGHTSKWLHAHVGAMTLHECWQGVLQTSKHNSVPCGQLQVACCTSASPLAHCVATAAARCSCGPTYTRRVGRELHAVSVPPSCMVMRCARTCASRMLSTSAALCPAAPLFLAVDGASHANTCKCLCLGVHSACSGLCNCLTQPDSRA